MHASIQVAVLWQHLKRTGLTLVFIGLLTLLILLALVGAVISHAPQGATPHAVPHGGLMAPVADSNDPEPSGGSTDATNGTVRIGGG
ncbi:MAG TPA: hypothetical protein VFN35_13155 [Ktedonobacteraceae bacterium]|nr:hypothetical protein [Ktedonobacteraceae bacterium]